MGNCQGAEVATVVIHHPGNKVEMIYWSVSANQIMNSNPGHYVALVVLSPTLKSENGSPMKQLKLLRPDDTLLIGHVYQLITFEDMLKEFASKKSGKLGKLLKESGNHGVDMKHRDSRAHNPGSTSKFDHFDPVKIAMAEEATTKVLEGSILLVGVGNGGQLYRALKNLAPERTSFNITPINKSS